MNPFDFYRKRFFIDAERLAFIGMYIGAVPHDGNANANCLLSGGLKIN